MEKKEKIKKIAEIAIVMSQFLKQEIDRKTVIQLQPEPDDMGVKCEKFAAQCGKFMVIAYDYGDGHIRCQID